MRAGGFVVAIAASGVLSGCGPVVYAMSAFPAESRLAEAKTLGADVRDPYRYFAAEAYLAKAKEEAGEGQYQDAMRFADRADALARESVERLRREQAP